ncbi:MAG: AAA family ATPase [Candidatus Heimdallarchaeaceae archaeon]
MIIESIQLKNFISHENTSISFPLGVSIIVGPNGAGKSAIMDAIYYALLGDKVRGDSVDDLIRRGTNQASVLLTFKAGDTTYNPLATTKAQVNAVVSEILGMDKNSIENSIFIRQGEITSLLDADPAERKEIIGKLIGLDKLEKSFTNMRDVIRHFEDKLSTYEVINTEIKTRQEVVKKLTKEINEIEQNINKTKQQLAKSKSKLKSMEKEFKEMEDKKSNHDKIASEIAILTERMKMKKENLNDLLEQQDKAEKAKKKCQKIEPEIKNIDVLDNYIKLIKDKKELEKRIVNLNKEFKRVQEYHDQLKEKEDAHVKYLENEKKQDSLKIDEYVTLLEDKEECPVCSSKLSESHRKEVIDNFSNEKIEMKEKLEKNTKKITNLNNQKEKLRKKLEQLNKLNIDDLIKKQEKLQSVIDELSKNSKRLKELNETVKKVDDLEKEMKNLENLLKNLKVDHTEYLSAKNALEKERALNEIKKELEQEKDSLIDIELQVSKIKEIFDEFPENPKEELKRLQNLKSDYDGLKPEAERLDTIKEDVKALKSKIKELEKNIDKKH